MSEKIVNIGLDSLEEKILKNILNKESSLKKNLDNLKVATMLGVAMVMSINTVFADSENNKEKYQEPATKAESQVNDEKQNIKFVIESIKKSIREGDRFGAANGIEKLGDIFKEKNDTYRATLCYRATFRIKKEMVSDQLLIKFYEMSPRVFTEELIDYVDKNKGEVGARGLLLYRRSLDIEKFVNNKRSKAKEQKQEIFVK